MLRRLGLSLKPGSKSPAPKAGWWDFPEGPSIKDFPYQCVVWNGGATYNLYASATPLFGHEGYELQTIQSNSILYPFNLSADSYSGDWTKSPSAKWNAEAPVAAAYWRGNNNGIREATQDVLFNRYGSAIQFPKTTGRSKQQAWGGYASTPDLLNDYPFQVVFDYNAESYLLASKTPFIKSSGNAIMSTAGFIRYYGTRPITSWGNRSVQSPGASSGFITLKEANADIYTDSSFSAVYFAKTRQ